MRKPTKKEIEKILGIVFFVIAFIVITWLRIQDHQEEETATDFTTYTTEQGQVTKEVETPVQPEIPALTFRNDNLLSNHYEKHGIDMGFPSKEAYQAAAAAVVENPSALHKTEEEDGDDIYYVEETNEFVVVSTDGYIRTYFYPDDGIDYFNRQ